MARLLLDTHVFLWAVSSPETLAIEARRAISDRANDVEISAAVAWEIAIKHASGKLTLPLSPSAFVSAGLALLGATPLAITTEHALAIGALPDVHRDPFDRIMIAQALCEGLTFVTGDAFSLRYPVRTLRV